MPDHDLVALWEAHCRYEFETRDVDATMATMVAEPYVNHVPTMAGGVDNGPSPGLASGKRGGSQSD
jgi:carboxymethylenebutenolidase